MTVIFLLPVVISFLLMAAHFLRLDSVFLAAVCLIVPLSLFIRARWAVRLTQFSLVAAAFEWLRVLFHYVQIYQHMGKPWTRLACILGAVALFTVLSAMVFRAKRLRLRYFPADR